MNEDYPVADDETDDLIASFNITRHYVDCCAWDVKVKGRYCEDRYIKACDELLEIRYKLIERLKVTGPVHNGKDGPIWSAEKLEKVN